MLSLAYFRLYLNSCKILIFFPEIHQSICCQVIILFFVANITHYFIGLNVNLQEAQLFLFISPSFRYDLCQGFMGSEVNQTPMSSEARCLLNLTATCICASYFKWSTQKCISPPHVPFNTVFLAYVSVSYMYIVICILSYASCT